MARRHKEAPEVHRERIAAAAESLFLKRGIEATTVDDIAKAAGYGKATVYVYFKNKEDIVGLLVLKSMKLLQHNLSQAVCQNDTSLSTRARYDALCECLVAYHERYPLYFSIALDEINVDFDSPNTLEVERDIYEVGEQTNEVIGHFIAHGIARNELRSDLPIPQTILLFWAALSGLIVIAANKAVYFEQITGQTKREFLRDGFDTLYRSIQA